MAKSKITEHRGGATIDFGDDVRIDRRFEPEKDGTFLWHVYRRKPVKGGVHPVHGKETDEKFVWMPEAEGVTEQQARDLAAKLAG
jgi:hypothetical protein